MESYGIFPHSVLDLGEILRQLPALPCTSSSAVERSAYTGLVGGSIPSSCTTFISVGVRTSATPRACGLFGKLPGFHRSLRG